MNNLCLEEIDMRIFVIRSSPYIVFGVCRRHNKFAGILAQIVAHGIAYRPPLAVVAVPVLPLPELSAMRRLPRYATSVCVSFCPWHLVSSSWYFLSLCAFFCCFLFSQNSEIPFFTEPREYEQIFFVFPTLYLCTYIQTKQNLRDIFAGFGVPVPFYNHHTRLART